MQYFHLIKEYLALIITFISAFFALIQIRRNHINSARLAWLENLKKLMADFIAEGLNLQIKRGVIHELAQQRQNGSISEKVERLTDSLMETNLETLKLLELKYRLVVLSLRPSDKLHNKLLNLLNGYMSLINKIPVLKTKDEQILNSQQLRAHSRTLTFVSRYIFEIEWESLKRGKIMRKWYFHFGAGQSLVRKVLELPLLSDEVAVNYTSA